MKKESFTVGIGIFVADQITKALVDTFVGFGNTVSVLGNFFSLTSLYNTGAAFSILEGKTWFLSILSIVVLILLLKVTKDFEGNRRNSWAFGLLFGGILGNFADRIFLGSVRDFLKFNIFGYHFPVFNIADAAIVLGIVLLLYSMIKGEDRSGSSSKRRRKRETR